MLIYILFENSYGLADISGELSGGFEPRNPVLGHVDRAVAADIASHLGCANLSNETAKATEVDILTIGYVLLDIRHHRLYDNTDGGFVITGRDSDFINEFSFSHNFYAYFI